MMILSVKTLGISADALDLDVDENGKKQEDSKLISVLMMLFASSLITSGMNAHGAGTLVLHMILKVVTFGAPVLAVVACARRDTYRLPEMTDRSPPQ